MSSPALDVTYSSNGFSARTAASGSGSDAGAAGGSEVSSQDRFLKMLVTQLQNQDPLNPMDNAQVTSQMAQLNTVTGIEKLNATVKGMSGQFLQMQALQGAALVGHDVLVPGNTLGTADDGTRHGAFEIDGAADAVQVEILGGGGQVLDTVQLGAQAGGRHDFAWVPGAGIDPAQGQGFRVTAKNGSAAVVTTPLRRDRVDAVSASGGSLTLDLRDSGSVSYADVRAFN